MISSSVVLNSGRLQEEVSYFLEQPEFVFDVETVGEHRGVPQVNQVTWLSCSTYGRTFVVPMGHPNGNVMLERPRKKKNAETGKFDMFPARWDAPPKQLRPSEAFSVLEPLFFSTEIAKIAHGATFDLMSVPKYFGERKIPGPYRDTIVEDWLLDENQRHGLKDVTTRRYKRTYDAEHVGRKVEIHPFNKVANYAFMDSKFTWLEHLENVRRLKNEGLWDLYMMEMDVLDVLLDMGAEGVPYDLEKAREMEPALSERRVQYEGQVYRAAGKKFNLNSPKQKVDILYGPKEDGGQGLKPWRLTKGGMKKQKAGLDLSLYDYSTDQEALEKFTTNKVVESLLEFQEVDRVLGTYIHGYIGGGKKEKPCIIFDGKVYPDFVQWGTVTGRFSGREPNLQNIPRPDTDLGKQIRSLFPAGPGHKLVVADYGQVELVVLAHFVGKGALYEGFFKGIDPHTMTAAMVFDWDPHDLADAIANGNPEAKNFRQIAKNLNFAIVYGAGPDKVAAMSKSTTKKAKGWLATHERQFPEIYAFKDRAIKTCKSRKPPHLTTLEGRKRRLPAIMSRDWGTAGRAERQAINSLIQGSAADLIKRAMIRANTGLAEAGAGRLLLTVHDELVCRATEERAEEAAAILREAMVGEGIQKMVDVPLSIDLHIVDTWAEAK